MFWQDKIEGLGFFAGVGRRMLVAMALVLLPWLVAVLFTTGGWAAFNLFAYAIMVFAAGYSILTVALPAPARAQAIVLAPAAGILAISALTAFCVRLGLPLVWTPAFWFGMMGAGALCLWTDRALLANSDPAHIGALAVLSATICVLYFLPGARNDAVQRPDGSFNWIYADTQYFHSVAASIKNSGEPPRNPGTATEELFYHFGPYAPAAAISRLDGLNLGDAFARVTRGASIWALMLSCFGLGTLLSLKATGAKFGGIMSVAGLFFYGSLLSLFSDEVNSASAVTGAILFKLPDVTVAVDGGPFIHLILGHSMLHGLVAITAIMGLCLIQRNWERGLTWRTLMLLVLPALAVAVNSVAALYCLGITGILLFWGHLRSPRIWLAIILMFTLFLGALIVMGYSHAPDAAATTLKQHPVWQWWTLTIWFIVGLGFRILGFRWISHPSKDPFAVLVLASTVGLLSLALLVQLDGNNERYGLYFLQSMLSIFAFSRLTHGCWGGVARSRWVEEWLALAKRGMSLLVACGLLIGAVEYATHGHSGIASFRLKLLLSLLILSLLAGMSALMRRNNGLSKIIPAILMWILLVGFLGWIAPWLNFGMGRMKMDITLAPGEVRGLKRFRELSAPGERFATNKHAIDSVANYRERSFAYGTLSERPVLLEGYAYHGVEALPWFNTLLRENDLMFSTTNPETLHAIAKSWRVQWLVARPGTDISLPKPLPPWLVEQQSCGDLRVYRVD